MVVGIPFTSEIGEYQKNIFCLQPSLYPGLIEDVGFLTSKTCMGLHLVISFNSMKTLNSNIPSNLRRHCGPGRAQDSGSRGNRFESSQRLYSLMNKQVVRTYITIEVK